MVSDSGLPAENRRLSIDRHVIFDVGVTLNALDGLTVFVAGKAQRAEGDSLVDLDSVADDRGFTDHDARAVVDKESLADRGPRMDIDSGVGVRPFRHDAGKKRDLTGIERMRDSMRGNRFHERITDDYLSNRASGRVAF